MTQTTTTATMNQPRALHNKYANSMDIRNEVLATATTPAPSQFTDGNGNTPENMTDAALKVPLTEAALMAHTNMFAFFEIFFFFCFSLQICRRIRQETKCQKKKLINQKK